MQRNSVEAGQPTEEGPLKLASIILEIRADIEAIKNDTALFEEMNFIDRAEALDSLEFDVIERIESLRLTYGWPEALGVLKQRAEMVRGQLNGIDEGVFQKLREYVASGHYTSAELRQRIIGYAGGGSSLSCASGEGYDSLDTLVGGFLLTEVALEEIRQQEPEMVFYQPTPARIVLEMAEKADLQQDDVFYDIGSGLGQVSILMHLLSGVRAKGVEIEPTYCDYARRCASGLNLSQVEFINVDAREADYSDGTIFFLYTPFEGRMLEQVLERLKYESRKRRIRLYTYGPCTLQVARHRWLERVDQNGNHADRLAIFRTPEQELEAAQSPYASGPAGDTPN